ncbi:hypothetical protein RJ640_021638 [Escallonia rubra]|uniref:Saposin B-type domain-containing protein n=1 Tax=Escallonia rubra TaxID=112253 RepID=A0AA88UQ97_9ASTE|nr:hypothetical protein RJ640_021638 [Escallonia rubra]
MGKEERIFALILLSSMLLLSWAPISHGSKKPVGIARKEDIPYIKCQVCQKLASQLYHQVETKQAEISPKKISEYDIIEIAENVCNLKKQEADWMLKIDIVEQGDILELVEQDTEGQCNSECKTIERACQEVIGYSDTDVAEYLYKNRQQMDSLVKFLCNDLTKACSAKPPPLPKDRAPGEPFIAKSSKEAEMDKIMKSMEGKVLRDKETSKGDWKQTIKKGILDTSEALKRHANKVSYRAQKWWRGAKAGLKKKRKSSKAEL